MPGGAAAVTGGRRRRLREEEIQRQRRRTAERCEHVFEKLSSDGQTLPESKVPAFLSQALFIKEEDLDPHAVQLVIESATSQQRKNNKEDLKMATIDSSDAQKQQESPQLIPKVALFRAVNKYGEYARQAKKIDKIFEDFDKNKDGVLSRAELRRALEAHERKANRSVNGVVIQLVVEEKDIDFILENCDVDGDGDIGPSEVLPAIATWEQMAALEIEQRENSCCVIL